MPYIKKEDKKKFEQIINNFTWLKELTPGELNYIITELIQAYLEKKEKGQNSYTNLNEVIGVLASCKLEFYRRVVAEYENKKISENGDVYAN